MYVGLHLCQFCCYCCVVDSVLVSSHIQPEAPPSTETKDEKTEDTIEKPDVETETQSDRSSKKKRPKKKRDQEEVKEEEEVLELGEWYFYSHLHYKV